MERGLFNIGSATTTTLVDKTTKSGNLSSISICNCNQDENVKIRLFLDDDTNQTSFIENVIIPAGASLYLDDIAFDNNVLGLKVQIEDAAGGSTVDTNIILK